jgi:hypothetical protein
VNEPIKSGNFGSSADGNMHIIIGVVNFKLRKKYQKKVHTCSKRYTNPFGRSKLQKGASKTKKGPPIRIRIHPKLPNELQNCPPIRMQANDENE